MGGSSETQKQKVEPWGPTKEPLKRIVGEGGLVEDWLNDPKRPSFYPGDTVANLNHEQKVALGHLYQTGMQQPGLGEASQGYQKLARGRGAGAGALTGALGTFGALQQGGGAGSGQLGQAGRGYEAMAAGKGAGARTLGAVDQGYAGFAKGRGAGTPLLGQAGAGYGRIAAGKGPGASDWATAGSGYGAFARGGGQGLEAVKAAEGGYGEAARSGGLAGAGGLKALKDTASGAMLGANPYLEGIAKRNEEAMQRSAASLFGGSGRYGSGAHQERLVDDVGDMRNSLLGGAYESERDRMLAAGQFLQGQGMAGLAGLQGAGESRAGLALAGSEGLARLGGQRTEAALAGLGGEARVGEAQAGLALQGLAGRQGVAAQAAEQQRAGLAGLGETGAELGRRALSGAQGGLAGAGMQTEAQLAGLEGLMGITPARLAAYNAALVRGDRQQQQRQAEINQGIDRFNFGQNRDINKVADALDLLGWGGQFGQRTTTAKSNPGFLDYLGALNPF